MRVIYLVFCLFLMAPNFAQKKYERMRRSMVKNQIEARGVEHKATLEAMRNVERHLFVPQSRVALAYSDRPIPIGYGQTISQPYIVAYMTAQLKPQSHWRILEIGTGSGYQAAILSRIVDSVYTIEIIPQLGKKARNVINDLGYKNVHVKIGDGYHGWKEHAPYDAIIVTAASEVIPPPLIEQLKEGGKMIIPVGSQFQTQYLILVTKAHDKVKTRALLPVRFVPFTRQQK